MQNTQNNQMLKKREIFRISIRRQQHEEIFKAKRFGQDSLITENDWQTPIESLLSKARQLRIIHENQNSLQELFRNVLKIISSDGIYQNKEVQNFLSFFYFHLQYMLPNNQENYIDDQFAQIVNITLVCILQNFYEQEENYTQELKLPQIFSEILKNLLVFIAKLSSQLDISKQSSMFEKIIKNVIEILHYINEIELFEVVGKLINNILKEKSENYQKIFEESTLLLILMEKYNTLELQQNYQIAYQIYLYLSYLTDFPNEDFGTLIFKDTYILSQILQEFLQDKDNNYQICLQEYLNFLANITNQIEKNKPKQYQLFNILIDKQIVNLVVDILMHINNSQQQIIHYGYKFLQNLSMISSSYSMEQLINQNVFRLIIFQINDKNYPQQLLYPLLSNLLATNKKTTKSFIFESGILGRILIGFQQELKNQNKYLLEITQCIINMFSDINIQQQQLLIQKSMLQCLFDYIIFVEIDQLDLRTCEEIYLTIEEQKQMNHEIILNEQFINKSKMIYKAIDDDDNNISCSIINLIDITE